jgi:hypothetical protein
MLEYIRQLLEIIATGVSDRDTLDELLRVIDDDRHWKEAHAMFRRIRRKRLRADASGDQRLIAQYCFEEICAKSIYNESDESESAPFDSDSPFWVVPFVFNAARELGKPERRPGSSFRDRDERRRAPSRPG